jgi:hypothetical protein
MLLHLEQALLRAAGAVEPDARALGVDAGGSGSAHGEQHSV